MDLEIRLLGKLKPSIGRHLLRFYDDWTGKEVLSAAPEDPFLREAHRRLRMLFVSHESGPDDVIHLTESSLDMHVEVDMDNYMDFLLEEFLPRALVSLDEGWFIYSSEPRRTMLSFDAKSKKITGTALERDSFRWQEKQRVLLRAQSRWEGEYGAMTARQWRSAYNRFLSLVADPEAQRALFAEGRAVEDKSAPIQTFSDLGAVYFTLLNLEDGFDHARRKGFLNLDEVKQLRPFDRAFRKYLPPEDASDDQTLLDPKWLRVCELARALRERFTLSLEEQY